MKKIGVLGINYRSAPLHLREKIAQIEWDTSNKIILTTCHRTEIYFSHDDLAQIQSELFQDIKSKIPHSHEHAFYSYFGKECFFHLACVTAGLDSAILAESDIQRQVKIAYEKERVRQHLPSPLHFLFQKSLKLGKKLRSTFPLFHTTFHLEGLIFKLAQKFPSDKLLFIGNSDINRKIIHYFWRKGQKNMTLLTHQLDKATPFALDYAVSLKDYAELPNWHTYDVVISATTSEKHLITSVPKETQTHLILDLSVPRTVDPSLRYHPELVLLNMEEIGHFFDHHHTLRMSEVESIKDFLQEAVDQAATRYESKTLTPI